MKTQNDKTIAFIMCTNNRTLMEESLYYINRLYIPEGYSLDFISIEEADSITSGYNCAMRESPAKYKVYLHQDVFIINRNFLFDMLDIFSEPDIGIMGLVGCVRFPENAMHWYGKYCGALISNNFHESVLNMNNNGLTKYTQVISLDGMLMATQYDIPWREDIIKGWDFYDISQSFEFRKNNYKVVIPNQTTPWVIHYDGILNLKNYYKVRKEFIKNYKTDLLKLGILSQ